MAVYVIGVGGTGSRILRALHVLIASGANTKGHEIIPISIDVDNTNKDTDRSLERLVDYIKFKNLIGNDTTVFSHKTDIKVPNILGNGEKGQKDKYKVILSDNLGGTFKNYIGYDTLEDIDKEFLKSIYSDGENQFKELNLNLANGFKGRPNIGCIAFNELKNVDGPFINLINSIAANPENKIIIIGSIFGGTGSSGLPQIIQIIADLGNTAGINNNIQNIALGAISVFPYYTIKSNTKGVTEIISSKFMSKTKSALKYYTDFSRLDSVYNIYDTPLHEYEYFDGGGEQKNDAIWTELKGAYAVIHFCNNGIRLNDRKTNTYGYFSLFNHDTENTSGSITFSNFYDVVKNDIIHNIRKLGVVWFILNRFLPIANKNSTYYMDCGLYGNENLIASLAGELIWFKDYFDEIQRTNREFTLFDFDAEGNNLSGFLLANTQLYIDEGVINSNKNTLTPNQVITDPQNKILNFTEKLATFYYNQLPNN